ncbi:MAG: hypothetical protein ACI4VH_01835 [Clostridia bacterium]
MKKLLILILIALLLTLSIFLVIQGIHIGNFEILGIKDIQVKSNKLDGKIQEAAKLAEKDYKQAVSDVETNAKKLKEEKANYDEMVATVDGETGTASQIEKYEIETLWVRLGNHATSEGVVMQMDVIKGNSSLEDVYNLKFTATGSYISITDFISAIENDSMLGFKIEEFKMNPTASGSDLQATFVCKDITIKDVSATTSNIPTDDNKNTNNTNQSNTTNTINTTNTSNAVNTNTAK